MRRSHYHEHRYLPRIAWILPIALASITLVSCNRPRHELATYRSVRDFQLTERGGQSLTRSNLLGKTWIANFFFAGCSTDCSRVMITLADLQEQFRTQPDVLIVSFTTDPRSDTPEALQAYAAEQGADPARWLFLTGERQQLLSVIVHDFLMPITKDFRDQADLLSGLVHSDQLALVDTQGVVRAYFDGLDPETPQRIQVAIKKLQATP